MKISGVVNESAGSYFVVKSIVERGRSGVLVVESDVDIPLFCKTLESIKLSVEGVQKIDVFELDGSLPNIVKLSKNLARASGLFVVVTSLRSLNQPLFSPSALFARGISVGDVIERGELVESLVNFGFSRTDFVEEPAEFATRGSVVDIFIPGDENPVRLYFDDNKVSAIKRFEIDTQNTSDFIVTVTLIDLKKRDKKLTDFGFDLYSYGISGEFDFNLVDFAEEESFSFENIAFHSFDVFISELERFSEKGFKSHIYYLNEREGINIATTLEQKAKGLKNIYFHQGYIRKGFYSEREKVFVVSSNEIFGREFTGRLRREVKKRFDINRISKGDYVVHDDYGIGIYNGVIDYTHRDEWGNIYTTECIEIVYAGGDRLYVSLDDFKKISKYIGDADKVKLSSLSSAKWSKVKERIKKEIEKIAYQIIKSEAKRKVLKIKPMFKTDMEDEFVSDFIYDETPDQKRAIDDVLRDLESDTPANRLIVGDVGFGKTEVAMRGAFRAVSNGYQVCVLCPTTILVEQHLRTFTKRFERFPVKIAAISRFTKPSEERRIRRDVENGVIDILIGTHKLLSEKIRFKNLAVLIIDEEHKFGVKQKEIIKNRYNHIHLFYLSATPIPRTLYQALSTIRDMSVIETPPLGRLPIETKVSPYSEELVVEAVDREIKRGGQIFYVYNRVELINLKFEKLKKLLGGVRICVVHGKMRGDVIEKVMYDFLQKKYDLMLSSTIIESGIDIPSVNTLIVEDAHNFGLAQLYQLRGRIGREKIKAFCYFFYPAYLDKEFNDKENLTKDAIKRLKALEEFSELGSGFRLSMRDLEIRGAGELLGVKQHGFINTVGLETYIRLLNDEISKIKGISKPLEVEPVIDIKVSAYIPADYINDDMERLIYYRRLANSSLKDIDLIVEEMKDLAGEMPQEVKNLIRIAKIKKLLIGRGVVKIIEKDRTIEFYFEKKSNITPSDISYWQERFSGRIWFFKTQSYDGISIGFEKDSDKISIISDVFKLGV